ncbi:MAG: C-terminal binding protein [Gemmatimonadota bacterium]|nr:C-terminal binding protein [Gemmatimonadota bacterium]
MAEFKVAISDCDHGTIEAEKKIFEEAGIEFELFDCKTEEEVIRKCVDAHGILSQYAPIKAKAIPLLENLKVLSRYGVGVDNLDLDAATAAGVAVCNVPDYCQDDVSTHAMALLLAIVRRVPELADNCASGGWDFSLAGPVPRTAGKTLGLYGFGGIARKLARKALGFEMRVIAFDPYVKQTGMEVELVDFERLLAGSDFLSLHAPLTPETEGVINAETIAKMKPAAYLVNTSRGGLINEADLAGAIAGGRLAGAGLDVLCSEPPQEGNPLVGLDKVIITPHSSFFSNESFIELKEKSARNLVEVLCGQPVTYCLNPRVLG